MPKHTGRDCVKAVSVARLIISHEHFVGSWVFAAVSRVFAAVS